MNWQSRVAATFVACLVAAPVAVLYCPSLLVFPFKAELGDIVVYSEEPISAELAPQLEQADELVAASEIAEFPLRRNLFLTKGGWRWRILALRSVNAFGNRRAFSNSIVLNTTDISAGSVENGRAPGGERTLAGVVAHETTHLAMARHYGEWRTLAIPKWKREGYADYIARESSLSDREAVTLRATSPNDIALRYYDYRRQVAAFLQVPGHTADDLFDVPPASD